jgi:nitrogen regulatory protein P-II 1
MVKIEAVVQPFRLDAIKAALDGLGIGGITICHVMDHDGPLGLKAFYRGTEYHVDTPRIKLEMLVSSLRADEVIEALSQAARTGMSCDDGTIWVCEVVDAMRIRNGARVQFALS